MRKRKSRRYVRRIKTIKFPKRKSKNSKKLQVIIIKRKIKINRQVVKMVKNKFLFPMSNRNLKSIKREYPASGETPENHPV
jgi:hypothetical protein